MRFSGGKILICLSGLCLAIYFILGLALLYLVWNFIYFLALFSANRLEPLPDPAPAPLQPIERPAAILTATWYDSDHCLGCRADRLMANGHKLDDLASTVAYNDLPLGSLVRLCDPARPEICASAIVSDRIGIPGRIDLTRGLYLKIFPILGKSKINLYE